MTNSVALEDKTPVVSPIDLGRRRLKRAGLAGFTAIAAQGLGMAVSFISIPLTVGYLGPERYGLWITISSLLAWLAISDVGFGSALVNALAEADGLEDHTLAQGLVATAFWTLLAVAFVIGLLTALLVPIVNWMEILNVSEAVSEVEVRQAAGLAIGFFCLSFPTSLVTSIYRGYQEAHKGNVWTIAGSLAALGALLIVVQQKGNLPVLILAVTGTMTAVRIINMAFLWLFERPRLLPLPRLIRQQHFRRLWDLGAFYFLQQLGNIGMFQIQPIILSQLQGPLAVGPFNVAYKLLTLPQQLLIMLLSPLLGAYGEAKTRGDWGWIRRALLWTTAGSVALMLGTAVPLALMSPIIIPRWAGTAMMPDILTIIWLSIYVIANGLATPLAILLQGLERAKDIAVLTLVNGAFTIIVSIWLVPALGAYGMALTMSIALIGISITYCLVLTKRLLYGVSAKGSGLCRKVEP